MRWGYVANVCIDNKNLDFIFEMMGGQTLRTHEQWDGVMSYAQHKQQHSCGSRGGSSQACRRDGIHQRHGDQSGLPWRAISQESASNAGDLGLIPGSRRSPGEGNGTPFQYSCLEKPIDGGTWWAAVHGVAKSRTRVKHAFTFVSATIMYIIFSRIDCFSWTRS